MNLLPEQFEKLQPHEFYSLLDGYKWRQEQTEDMQAYWTACMMSVHTKKPVSPRDLIKPLRGETIEKRDRKADEAHLREVFKDVIK